ncbi:MAG: hypothetical protein KBG15_01145 [Kofleriaceae bacterium]|nr:hypothetical protein [Kofleriaceae bacterium]
MNLPVVANALRTLGLRPARLAAYGHTSTIAHLPRIVRQREWCATTPVAAIPLLLWCDGANVPAASAQAALGRHFDDVVAAGFLTCSASHVHAPFAVVPIEHGFVCFDFDHHEHEANEADARVCWPDDSSHHLIGALPDGATAGITRWLDVGSGPAFAPLHRPRLAEQIIASDINPRAVTMASRGLGLSCIAGLPHIQTMIADGVPTSAGMFDLVTCNAAIPAPVHAASWHFAPVAVLQDFLLAAPRYLQPTGTIILHALLSANEVALVQRQGGTAHLTGYTSAVQSESTAPGFAVLWWQPHRPGPFTYGHRELTMQRPHIDAADHPTWWAPAA